MRSALDPQYKATINRSKGRNRQYDNTVGEFKTHSKQQIDNPKGNQGGKAYLNTTTDQTDVTDMPRIFHPTVAEYAFSLSAQGKFSRIDEMLGHKISLNNVRRLKSYQVPFSKYSGIKLEVGTVRNLED